MRIYFSGSIRGAKADREIYRIIVDHLKSYGKVLTEHIVDADKDENPELCDDEIYKQDIEWLKSADVLVAEVSSPSLGVGYEIGKAEEYGIPVLCLFNELCKNRLSAMIEGNHSLVVEKFNTVQEATKIIDKYINLMMTGTNRTRVREEI
jgi:nucleoside 2-deoxyribosyltransferase